MEKLFALPLVPANTLSTTDPTIVSIFMQLTVQQSNWPTAPTDHDPGIAVGDGSQIVAFLAADEGSDLQKGEGACSFLR